LSGLNQIQNGFKNLLKNGFEKLEKKKKKGFSPPFCFRILAASLRSPVRAAHFPPLARPVSRSGPSPAAGPIRVRAPFLPAAH
jgi:hypothetical protein